MKLNYHIRPGIFRIGYINSIFIPFYNSGMNYLNIRGVIEIGGLTLIGGSAKIVIDEGAVLNLGKSCFINNHSKNFL